MIIVPCVLPMFWRLSLAFPLSENIEDCLKEMVFKILANKLNQLLTHHPDVEVTVCSLDNDKSLVLNIPTV